MLTANHRDSNPRSASVRINSMSVQKMAGQLRHDFRKGPQPDYVDSQREHLNRSLIGPEAPGQLRQVCEARRKLRQCQRAMKKNAAVGTRGIITFGAEAGQMFESLSNAQQDRAFRALTKAIARRLNTTVHSLVVHNDEATIHAHFVLAAYDMEGHPLSKSTSPKVLSELQDITYEVMSGFCPSIERGHRYGDRIAAGATYAETIHKSVRELHRDLPNDLAKKRNELATLEQAVGEAQTRVHEMGVRVQKLRDKAALSEREAKRLATYENRLSERISVLKKAETASESLRHEAERLAEIAKVDRIAEEEKADAVQKRADALKAGIDALAVEVNHQTIKKTKNGKLYVKQPDLLRPAFQDIAPAMYTAADFVGVIKRQKARLQNERNDLLRQSDELLAEKAAFEVDKKNLDQERQVLREERAEVQKLHKRLFETFLRLMKFLKRDDLTKDAWLEGKNLEQEARDSVALEPPKNTGPRLG